MRSSGYVFQVFAEEFRIETQFSTPQNLKEPTINQDVLFALFPEGNFGGPVGITFPWGMRPR